MRPGNARTVVLAVAVVMVGSVAVVVAIALGLEVAVAVGVAVGFEVVTAVGLEVAAVVMVGDFVIFTGGQAANNRRQDRQQCCLKVCYAYDGRGALLLQAALVVFLVGFRGTPPAAQSLGPVHNTQCMRVHSTQQHPMVCCHHCAACPGVFCVMLLWAEIVCQHTACPSLYVGKNVLVPRSRCCCTLHPLHLRVGAARTA